MVLFKEDKSGIHTLGGFSYQIRVFALYLSELSPNAQLEFEKYDDVSVKNLDSDLLDKNEDKFKKTLKVGDKIEAIQVKRTKLDNETALKVVMNWMLLENSDETISKYVLFTSDEYANKNNLFNITSKQLFEVINKEKLKENPRSIKGKLKKQFNNNFSSFGRVYDSVENKMEFKSIDNIDDEILRSYAKLFNRTAFDNEVIYSQRIRALLEKLTFEILEAVNNKEPYSIKESDVSKLIEKITLEIQEDDPFISFIDYKEKCGEVVDIKKIAGSREYKQLTECGLNSNLLKSHIIYNLYYGRYKLLHIERSNISRIKGIEETTFDNFSMVKQRLQFKGEDFPFNRLDQTKLQPNSYANNEQLKWGSAIYLTKANTEEEKKISWKDE